MAELRDRERAEWRQALALRPELCVIAVHPRLAVAACR